MTLLLHSATRIDEAGVVPDAWLLFDGDTIAAAGSGALPDADEQVDLGGATLVPGFVDLHSHGGGGHAYDDGGEELALGLAAHRRHGTTRSLISLVANPLEATCARLAAIADLVRADPLVLGSHLEGPYLAPSRAGAHHPDHLRLPDPGEIDALITAAGGTLRQVTLAPELPGGLDAVARFAAAGVTVAIGHTEADAATTRAAIDAGARLVTHAFNAMPGIHHRAPGPLPTAVADERVTVELILDGLHVDVAVARMLIAAAPGRVALVTDAMAAAGADDGDYRLGALNVTVRAGRALLSGTTTLAGSTLTQDAALRIARTEVGMPAPAAVAAVTAVPARAIGAGDRVGSFAPGAAADAVVLRPDNGVDAVWAAGSRLA